MPFLPAHIALDGTQTFRNKKDVAIAYAGSAYMVVQLMWEKNWAIYGSPTQEAGLFLVVAPGYRPSDFAIDAGEEGWISLSCTDMDDLIAD